MTASYPLAASSVNPLQTVSTGAASLYRWVHRWHGEGAAVAPHTRYLASKLGKSERHIYRWLAELRAVDAIACEVKQGISRRILPLVSPLPVGKIPGYAAPKNKKLYEKTAPKMSGVMSGVMSGALPVDALNASDASTEAPADSIVARLLAEAGVTLSTAAQIVKEQGAPECLKQLEALPFRKAQDRAAVLVASIRGKWSIPSGLIRHRDRLRSDARRAAKASAAAILAADRQKRRQELESALLGLSEAQREALRQRAEVQYRMSHPALASRVLSMGLGGPLLRGEMLRLLALERGINLE